MWSDYVIHEPYRSIVIQSPWDLLAWEIETDVTSLDTHNTCLSDFEKIKSSFTFTRTSCLCHWMKNHLTKFKSILKNNRTRERVAFLCTESTYRSNWQWHLSPTTHVTKQLPLRIERLRFFFVGLCLVKATTVSVG